MTRGFRSEDEPREARLVEVAIELRHETPAAWLVFDGAVEVWLPKSQVELNGDGTVTLPEWLALEKGLV